MYRRPYIRAGLPRMKSVAEAASGSDTGALDPCPWGADPVDMTGRTPVCASGPTGKHCIPCSDPQGAAVKCCLKSPEDYSPYMGDEDVSVDDVPTLCPWGQPIDGSVCKYGCFVQDREGGVKGKEYEVKCCNEEMAKAGELEYDFTSVCDPECAAQSGVWPTGCIYCPARNTGEGNFVACKGADDMCTTRIEHCSVFAPTKWDRRKGIVDQGLGASSASGGAAPQGKKLSQDAYSAALSAAYARHLNDTAAVKQAQQRAALAASALAAASRLHFWGF
jgi:hypothetical protein